MTPAPAAHCPPGRRRAHTRAIRKHTPTAALRSWAVRVSEVGSWPIVMKTTTSIWTSRRRVTSPLTAVQPKLDRLLRHRYVSLFPSRSSASVDTVRHTTADYQPGHPARRSAYSTSRLPIHGLDILAGMGWIGRRGARLHRRGGSHAGVRRWIRSGTRADRLGRRSSTKRRREPSLIRCTRRTATGPTRDRAIEDTTRVCLLPLVH